MERILSRGEVRLLRNDVDVDETGVMEVPYANLPCVAAGCLAGCHRRMSQQDATRRCKGRMTKRGCFDVSALSDSGMSRQDVTARCHSRQSRPRCLSVVSRQVATARCHGRLSRHNVTTGCHSAIEGCRSKMTQQRVTSR